MTDVIRIDYFKPISCYLSEKISSKNRKIRHNIFSRKRVKTY